MVLIGGNADKSFGQIVSLATELDGESQWLHHPRRTQFTCHHRRWIFQRGQTARNHRASPSVVS